MFLQVLDHLIKIRAYAEAKAMQEVLCNEKFVEMLKNAKCDVNMQILQPEYLNKIAISDNIWPKTPLIDQFIKELEGIN